MPTIGQCSICFSTMLSNEVYGVKNCGHTFHQECILQWIQTAKSCSSCRVKASAQDVIKLYIKETTLDDTFSTQNTDDSKIVEMQNELEKVKEENKKLQEEKRKFEFENKEWKKRNKMVEAENKKLKEEKQTAETKMRNLALQIIRKTKDLKRREAENKKLKQESRNAVNGLPDLIHTHVETESLLDNSAAEA